tara:strand:- start:130 stop:591 length:462 start_codon:yes stop_codon:yes gene_type:complete
MNKFIIGLLLAFSIISNGFAADRPKLVGLEILLSKYDATDDSSYMLDVLQRCSGLSITLSSLMDNQDKKQADSYMLASVRALNAANVIKEKSNINGSGTTTAEEQNLVGIKIYADAYKSWLDANKMELGYYFMDDEKFKREMTLCIQIIKDLP